MNTRKIITSSIGKALIACLLFVLSYVFYNIELIRANVEDVAFDVVTKISIYNHQSESEQAHIMLFAFDDAYMKSNALIDENDNNSYGYIFPRGRIATFIEEVDELVSEVDIAHRPKALLIDYDMSFTSLPYGKSLSQEDEKLLNVLKKDRPYKILLPKTSDYNFIESSQNVDIQTAIKEGRIIFVSVSLIVSNDGIVRRYQSQNEYNKSVYQSAEVVLWALLRNDSGKHFLKNDTIANRIWMKSYASHEKDGDCEIDRSHWSKLSKYSANCSLFDIAEEDFSASVMILGGTHSQNTDTFNVNPLSILKTSSTDLLSGLDIHGNALMTMLYLDGPMQRLSLWLSLLIVFFSFVFLSSLTSLLFHFFKVENKSSEFLIMLSINVVFLISISVYLLREQQLWFNWFIPLVLIELIESYNLVKIVARRVSRRKNV